MKDYIRIMCAVLVVLILIPLVSYADRRTALPAKSESVTVGIYFTERDEKVTVSLHDYIVGAVFAQMPADFGDEAIRAQAVLASTYIRRRRLSEEQLPTEALHGALLSDDRTKYHAYFTEEQAKELYGSGYEQALKRVSAAASYAEKYILTYDGEPIAPAFHGISYGRTESAADMWGEGIPYLVSVGSESDAELRVCKSEVSYTAEKLSAVLSDSFGIKAEGEPSGWIRPTLTTSGGTVLKVSVCGTETDSETFCEKLGLASQHFSVGFSDGKFTFSVMGCGHLVGMSQYGANEMAKQGSTAEQILTHYFTGTKLEAAE